VNCLAAAAEAIEIHRKLASSSSQTAYLTRMQVAGNTIACLLDTLGLTEEAKQLRVLLAE
jgi:hypothetical protein